MEAIDQVGSISGAGRLLNMSYRTVWLLVDTLNRCWQEPLVDTTTGGRANGGAVLTPFGREVLVAFRAMERRIEEAAQQDDYAMLVSRVRREPLAPTAPSHPILRKMPTAVG